MTATKIARISILGILLAGAYLAGSWNSRRQGEGKPGDAAKTPLYYQCPMHPGIQSDKPGPAPCCGMKLEPVFADGSGSPGSAAGAARCGIVHISPAKQQTIGLRSGAVERVSGIHNLRLLGRIAADSSRIYPLRTSAEGWIRRTYPDSVGSLVKKGQILATFYPPGLRSAELYYFQLLKGVSDSQSETVGTNASSIQTLTDARMQQAVDGLRTLGMQEDQIEELGRTRQPASEVILRSPQTGFVLVREVFPGLRVEKGTELYRIADLNRVWIYADIIEGDAWRLPAWFEARVYDPRQRRSFSARSSNILPEFDPLTHTLRVRLEADNPGFFLRPGMFVDLEVPVNYGTALVVPADAILFSGTKNTVFVDRGDGFFEPRQVETGWNTDGRVEIRRGLLEGERIVFSAAFLVDSESRLEQAPWAFKATAEPLAAAGRPAPGALDPIHGISVGAVGSTLNSKYGRSSQAARR
ncbi:MAG TPA: efflux RND transporter periplasmic adaptor subunit [Acidobacteriota bacterium]|nr:efflux RND transporter periplasmic adaptor subunit [Acidobacteriota bacterium]